MPLIRHIVLLKLRNDLSNEQVEGVFGGIDDMMARVPGVLHYSRGPYDSHIDLNRGYNYGLTMDFDTIDHRDAYHADPANRVPVDVLAAEALDGSFDEAVIAFDYWINAS